VGGEFGVMAADPVEGIADGSSHPAVAQPDHRQVTVGGLGLDALI
jgi:hypothetical protein